jgi:hypothetical protein
LLYQIQVALETFDGRRVCLAAHQFDCSLY